jgi:hypothetical protein
MIFSFKTDGFAKSSPAKAGLGVQKLINVGAIHESPLQARRNDEVAA